MVFGRQHKRMHKLFEGTLFTVIVFVAAVFFIFPYLWMLVTSFKPPAEAFAQSGVWIFRPTFVNYLDVLISRRFSQYFINSLIVAAGSTVFSISIGTLAAYGFARFRFPANLGSRLPFWILTTRMLPPVIVLLPIFLLMRTLGLLDTYIALILAYSVFNLPFVVWFMKGFFDDLPHEFEEAALIDGCNLIQTFWRILVPIVSPAMVTTAIFCFIFSWNEFLFALVITGRSTRTLPVATQTFITNIGILWGPLAAASMIITLPVLFFAWMIRQYLIRGLTYGAIK